MQVPKKLNGYPVIRSEQHKDCVTVMVDAPGKYVVATWWPVLGYGWAWGHYFHGPDNEAFMAAMTDFNETVAARKENR